MPVDLGAVRDRQLQEQVSRQVSAKVQEDKDAAETLENARLWDKAMRRTFKGIVSRPSRHRALMRKSMYER